MKASGYRYGPAYREAVRLRGGKVVLLRQVRPQDKPLFRRAIAEYSPESFYRRFLVAKPRLSEQELKYLTEFDGVDHWAICAVEAPMDGGRGLAVARFVRNEIETEAEFAIYVGDPVQKQGLGRTLMVRLARAALERGIESFYGEALPSNREIVGLCESLDPSCEVCRRERRIEMRLNVRLLASG
jgi:GNAT superfamily N-acetyltransferase